MTRPRTGRAQLSLALALALALAVLVACSGESGSPDGGSAGSDAQGPTLPAAQLSLVAYSTPQEAYDAITEAFRKTPQGRNVTFTKSYGGSGDQSRAVEAGLGAD